MSTIYQEWFPLGKELPYLAFEKFEATQEYGFRIYLKRYNQSAFLEQNSRVIVDFDIFPISFRIVNESYKEKTLFELEQQGLLGKGSFFISTNSNFIKDFYEEAGSIYQDYQFEHLLILVNDELIDVVIAVKPKVYIVNLQNNQKSGVNSVEL